MSSLAAARADGFYYPPEFDPAKHKNINKFRGQHALRDRARKLDEGILVIRFEMPFNVWCNGCNHLIGKGVRFNAEKKQVGNYFSTKIWSFTMRSPCCQTQIVVQTDPKNSQYVVKEGGRRKTETYNAEEAGTVEMEDPINSTNIRDDDPFYKLEKKERDRRIAVQQRQQLTSMYTHNDTRHKDTYGVNKALRAQLRAHRKEEQGRTAHRDALGLSPDIQLLPESEMDKAIASTVTFKTRPPTRGGAHGPGSGLVGGGIVGGGSGSGGHHSTRASSAVSAAAAGDLSGIFGKNPSGSGGHSKAARGGPVARAQNTTGASVRRGLHVRGGVEKTTRKSSGGGGGGGGGRSNVARAAALLKRQRG